MSTQLNTPSGTLEGEASHGVFAFKGIPYAAPPVGKLRLRAPERPRAWQGIRPARRFGPSAPQTQAVGRLIQQMVGVGAGGQSEDCLYLNVWTPSPRGRRPVLVWIHGGAFVLGSGATRLYSGSRLARRGDAVVVTLNYRLGALGFLNLRDLAPGAERPDTNLGILDQIAALEWVRDNIEAFGGDPECVTIFGESAGAMSVGTLLGCPRARGLFHRAILQSGAAHNVSSRERALEVSQTFLEALGMEELDPEALRRTSLDAVLRAQRTAAFRLGMVDGNLPWQPSVDDDVLPRPPLDAIRDGLSSQVPVLVGSNREEWKLFMLGDGKGHRLDEQGLRRRIERTLRLNEPDPGRRAQLGDLAFATYTNLSRGGGPASPADGWVAFQSDRIFHYPATRLAELHAASGGDTFAYRFDWAPPLIGRRIGACHGLEIPFVFGTLRDPGVSLLLGTTQGARRLSHRMQRAWLEFARTGRPGHGTLSDWPRYESERRATMRLETRCGVVEAPSEDRRRFWEKLL